MKRAFEIRFDFPLAHSDLIFSLTAVAEIHHSEPYYSVDHFHFAGAHPAGNDISILPAQEIKQITRGNTRVWVHKDSERESMLSLAMGKAIDEALKNRSK